VPVVPTGLLLAVCRYSERILRLADMDRYRQYAHARSYFSESNLDALFQPATLASVNRGFEQVILDHFRVASERSDDFINQMLYVDTKTFLPDLNLAYSDKLSMAASIEVRVPFLDNNIVDFMSRVPPHLKLNGFNQKYLLRKAMQGLLPQPVITRRKAGFGLPVRSWLRNELKEMVRDLLSEETVRSRGIFDPAMVQNLIAQNEGGKQDYTLQIWALLTLELWQQTYLDSAARQVAPLAYSH
jgi:asparagine synthase (glutamine-hydrolysing)